MSNPLKANRNPSWRLCRRSIFLSSALFATLLAPASAIAGQLGVVRSQDNSQQWAEILNRLQAAGLNYCILEASNWEQKSDLDNVSILLLPNVATLNGLQVESLGQWLGQGGRAIVTGPTGTLAQPQVQEQLRPIFGAYWGFSNSAPATLRPLEDQPSWGNRAQLSSNLVGGVVLPAGIDSKTAAIWLSEGKPPAVVVSQKVAFFGWRWGVDNVAPASLDTAWLQGALNHFQFRPTGPTSVFSDTSRPCNPKRPAADQTAPVLPDLQGKRGQEAGGRRQEAGDRRQEAGGRRQEEIPGFQPAFVPLSPTPPTPLSPPTLLANPWQGEPALSDRQVVAMERELESLLARFESTLLAAEASQSDIDPPAKKLLEHSRSRRAVPSNHSAYRAALEAKEGLKQFRLLVSQGNYTQAREQWLKARRTLWDNYPTDRQIAQPEIRAMWVDRGTITRSRSERELAVIFDRMAAAGINTVFFETVNASYPIYPSRIAPEQNPLTRGWDPLKAAVKLAHERGMELHAWVWVFAAANQGHNGVLNQPANYLGPVLSRHPDWVMTDREGNTFDRGTQYRKAFLDPANPAVQRYLLALLEEIASNYQVDGIQLDYIRYPFQDPKFDQTFGYSQSSRWLFKELTGVDPLEIAPGHPLWSQWTGFRIKQVDSFVAAAAARLKQRRPDLLLSAAVFPMERRERFFRLQQNWEEWMERGWVDAIVLMTYALDTGNLEERTQPLFDRSLPASSLVLPGLRLLKVPDSVTFDQLQLVRNMPAGGFALFAAENLNPNLQSILSRTQGASSSGEREPSLLRQPFQAAAARYQSLRREWSFLLANQQLAMDGANLKAWAQQVDGLSLAFDQLAQKPSPQNLAAVRKALARFQGQFPQWMSRQGRVQPYQVQVWQNHLITLERLLSYGERLAYSRP